MTRLKIGTWTWMLVGLSVWQMAWANQDLSDMSPSTAKQLHTEIIAIYQSFADTTTHLNTHSQTFCATPNATGLSQLQQDWRHSMVAWSQTANVRFGAVKDLNHDLKIQFFPDKRGTIRRKLPALLQNELPLTAEQLAQQGVAASGLPALEWLLFEADALTLFQQQPRRCEYLQASSQLLQQQATAIVQVWQQVEVHSFDYATLLKSSLEWLELSKVVRIGAPMGKLKTGKQSVVKPHLAESWRSQHSLANLRAGIQGWQQLWLNDNAMLATQLPSDLVNQLDEQATAIIAEIDKFDLSLFQALQSDALEVRSALQNLYFEMDYLLNLVRNQLADALGVTLGFNSLDGD